MNEQGELYITLLTETLLYQTITMDNLRTLLRLVVPNTDIHKKRGTRTDSQTPSLDDGGLVHFNGPRLIGYNQLPLSPRVVTPTKVFLWNRHPLSSSSIYSNTEQDADQNGQSSR